MSYIKETLDFFSFLASLTKHIMFCISTSSIHVLINGRKIDVFYSIKGIKQGDPMSPYLFILCIEHLSRNIQAGVDHQLWKPIQVCRGGPRVSHLFFTNDLTLFARADKESCDTIMNILRHFGKNSGKRVNCAKSRVIFFRNYSSHTRAVYATTLDIKEKTSFGKYLGFPIFNKRPKNSDFQYFLI